MRKHPQSAVNTLLMILLLGIGMVLGSQGKGWGQEPVVIYSETFGPIVDSLINVNEYTGWDNLHPITYSGNVEIRTTQKSDASLIGVEGASGGANVFFSYNSEDKYFLISGINTSFYSNIQISFLHFKGMNDMNNELNVEVSSDGNIWHELIYSRPTGSGTVKWLQIFPEGEIPVSDDVRIRFSKIATPGLSNVNRYFRIDDIIIKGIPFPHIVYVTPVGGIPLDCGSTSEVAAFSLLPSTTSILDSEGTSHQVNLDWDSIQGYNPSIPGDYTVTASFDLPDGVIQSDPPTPLEVTATITVLPGTIVPEFDPIGPLCQGDEPSVPPIRSRNDMEGVWWPEIIDPSIPGTVSYTFHATEVLCVLPYIDYITVNEAPVVTAGGDISIPYGSQATLSGAVATGGTDLSYFWSPESLFDDHTVLHPSTIALTENVWVTLTVTNEHGCNSSDQLQITVDGGPLQAHASAEPAVLCYGGQVQLYANVAGGAGEPVIFWTSDPPGFESDEANPVDVPSETTTYFLMVTDGFDSYNLSVTVEVNPVPELICPDNFAVCSNDDSFNIAGALVDGVAVQGGYYMLNGNEVTEFDPAAYEPGSYYQVWYNYMSSEGCEATCSFVITVNEAPQVTAGGDIEVPYGLETTLSGAVATGGTDLSYFWSPESLFDDHTVLHPTTIVLTENVLVTLTVTNKNGCSSSDQLQITVDGGPLQAQAIASHTVLCSGEQVQLFSNVSGGAGYPVISWTSDPPGFESNEANPVDVPSETTTYFLVVTDGIDTRESSVEVQVNPMPVLSCPESLSVCSNDDAFEITGALVDGVAIEGGYYMLDGDEITVYDPAAYASGIDYPIWYHFMSSDGCEATCSFTITLNEAPVVDAGSDVVADYGTSVTLDEAVASGTTDQLYHWRPEDIFEDHTVIHPTTISLTENVLVFLTVSDANGCSSSDQLHITVDGAPLSAQPVAEPIAVCAGEPVQLFANAAGGMGEYTYLWTTDNGDEVSTDANPEVYPYTPTTYYLTVTDELGGNAQESVPVTVHQIPEIVCPSNRTATLNANSFELVGGTPAGGTYYLNGTLLTHFDPAQEGLGSHAIDYIYRDENGCEASCSFNIEVVEELPRRLQVTFNVNMSFAPKFDPDLDKLYITGSMFNFAVPGAMPEAQRLHPTDDPELYTWTRELPIGRYYYKYFLNEGWAGEEWPSAPIRIADVSRNSNNVFNDYFGRPDNPTSVLYLSSQPINVFPNPVQYTLYITSTGEEPLRQIRIINMLGQIVYAEHIDHISSYRVDVNNIPPGLYVVQVHSFTGWQSTKVQVIK